MPQNDHLAVGIDIGTSKIAICIGTVQEGNPIILSLTKSPSGGVSKGTITDIEGAVSALSSALIEAERVAGFPVQFASIGLADPRITATTSKGIVAVNQANSLITPADTQRAVDAAQAIALPPNQEIIEVVTRNFSVDGQDVVKDPTNMSGVRLEADTYVIGAPVAAVRNIQQVIKRASIEPIAITYAPIAAAAALLDKAQMESGVMLLNFGAATTSLIVFEDGDILHTAILPVGSSHITNDIAIGLRTNLHNAERIKQECAYALSSAVDGDETIDLSEFDPTEETTTSRRYVSEIVEARLNEIFSMVRDELRSVGRDGTLPAGAILTGGGARLAGLVEATKDMLQLPAALGIPQGTISGMIDRLDDPIYSTAVALMLTSLNQQPMRGGGFRLPTGDLSFNGLTGKAKKIFKNLLP